MDPLWFESSAALSIYSLIRDSIREAPERGQQYSILLSFPFKYQNNSNLIVFVRIITLKLLTAGTRCYST